MKLEIIECDRCGKDCSDYESHVVMQYPRGGQKFLCKECAEAVFTKESEKSKCNYQN